MNYRFAVSGDEPMLIKLRFDYFAAEGWKASDEESEKVKSQLSDYYTRELNRGFYAALALNEKGEILSTASLVICEKPANLHSFPTGKTGLILNVLTYPEHRGKGYATELLKMLIELGKRKELSLIELSASEMGRPVYEKLGFRVPEFNGFTAMKLLL